MPATEVNVIIPNVLGYVEQKIKNVQPSAEAVCTAKDIHYRYPVILDMDNGSVQELTEAIDNAFQTFYSKLETIKFTDPETKEETTLTKFLDNGKEDSFFKFTSDLPQVCVNLLSSGTLYSDVRKSILKEEKGLTDNDFTKPAQEKAKAAGKVKPVVEVQDTGSF